MLDTQGRIISVNEAFARMHGYPVAEMLRLGLAGLDVEGMAPVPDRIRRIMAGETLSFNVEHYHKDGHVFPLAVTAKLIAVGQEQQIVAIHRDLSEIKRTADELRAIAQRLQLALKATNDVVWDWDIVRDMQQWNMAGTSVFGWTEIVERPGNAQWWVDRVHPGDRQRVHETFFAVVNNPQQDVWHDEYRFLKADGTYADVLDRSYVLRDDQGRAVRMVGAMLDITTGKRAEAALRSSEEKYRLFVDTANEGIWSMDREHRTNYVNQAMKRSLNIRISSCRWYLIMRLGLVQR